jgi:hypothetical protein
VARTYSFTPFRGSLRLRAKMQLGMTNNLNGNELDFWVDKGEDFYATAQQASRLTQLKLAHLVVDSSTKTSVLDGYKPSDKMKK